MSTIRARRRWIRIELGAVLVLVSVWVYPQALEKTVRSLSTSSVYERVTASLEESSLKRAVASGDEAAIRQLAWSYASEQGYCRFMNGDAESLLRPLVDAGDPSAILLLASIVHNDPDRARRLHLQAADLGDLAAQSLWMREMGLDMREPGAFMRHLFRLQSDRPGWKTSYDRYMSILQDQAARGNDAASLVLGSLDSLRTGAAS